MLTYRLAIVCASWHLAIPRTSIGSRAQIRSQKIEITLGWHRMDLVG